MIEPFIPPRTQEIIDIVHSFSLIKSLQKFSFLPALHAFPGICEVDREVCAFKVIKLCAGILATKGRSDIDFVDF